MEENEKEQEKQEQESQAKENKGLWFTGAIIIILIIVIAVVLIRQNRSQPTALSSPSPIETQVTIKDSSILVSNQPSGESVSIDSATLVNPGYIVIHEQKDGELGPVIGNSPLFEAGTFENVSVDLDRLSIAGETLYAMLHDDDGNAQYEFPGADVPTLNSAQEVVVLPFEVE